MLLVMELLASSHSYCLSRNSLTVTLIDYSLRVMKVSFGINGLLYNLKCIECLKYVTLSSGSNNTQHIEHRSSGITNNKELTGMGSRETFFLTQLLTLHKHIELD